MNYEAYQSYHSVDLGARTAQASPLQLVLILMDGLLDELARARAHILAKRYELKAKSLDRAINMLHGLSSALDEQAGGELVEKLDQLYEYCAQRLYLAGVRLDVTLVDEAVGLLETLREGWRGMAARHG